MRVALTDGGRAPSRGSDKAAGLDLYATQSKFLWPLCPTKIQLSLRVELPDMSWAKIEARSGLGGRGVVILGGVIDEDYRGVIVVQVVLCRWRPLHIACGDRAAQLVVQPRMDIGEINVVTPMELTRTERGEGGFGSTGR